MAWAVVSDVSDLTGKTVTAEELAQAQAIVEIACARTDTVPEGTILPRDLEWLRRAVAYEAAWITANPDLFTRMEVTTLLQDGVEARDLPPDALTLAPLARRALRRLSWKKTRSTHIISEFERQAALYPVGGDIIDYPGEDWRPLDERGIAT